MISERLSVLVPVYKMERTIERAIEGALPLFDSFASNYELVLINDGSPDKTLPALMRLKKKYPTRIVVVSYEKNKGKGNALKKGFERANGAYIAICDADMELSPDQLKNFFALMKREKADIVIGSKRHPQSEVRYSRARKLISFAYFCFVRVFFNLPIKDTQTGLKLFKREALARVFPRILVKAFAYDLETLVAAHRAGYRIAEAPVKVLPIRNFGFIRFRVLFETFRDTMAILYRTRITKYYDRLFPEAKRAPFVSVIIPIKTITPSVRRALSALAENTYSRYETLLIADSNAPRASDAALLKAAHAKITRAKGRSDNAKRTFGAEYAKGELLAFIDEGACPETDWLTNAVRALLGTDACAVGGPIVNKEEDESAIEAASALTLSSRLVCGNYRYRYLPGSVREVNDYPSANFLITKKAFVEAGGFKDEYASGEDSRLCERLTKMQQRILYTPEAVVRAHSQPLFIAHLTRLALYARHRGFFARVEGGNSRKLAYSLPSFFLLYSLLAPFIARAGYTAFGVIGAALPLVPAALYALGIIGSAVMSFSLRKGILRAFGIVCSNIAYGIHYLLGICATRKGMHNGRT